MLLLVILPSLFHVVSYSQNLVINGDFENFNACPSNLGQIVYSPGFTSFPTATGWVSPLVTTPDYHNRCAGNPVVSVPKNFVGYQQPHSGDAYAGLVIEYYASSSGNVWREYLTTKFTKPMNKDSAYCVRFFVSATTASLAYPPNIVDDMVVNDMGAHISDTMPHKSNKLGLNLPYHIINDTSRHLIDTGRWHEIQGIYIAKGGEQWITVGSFERSLLPAHTRLGPPNAADLTSYMYVDDVSVLPAEVHDSLHKIRFCEPGVSITSSFASGPYHWNTGDTTRTLRVTQKGDYSCRRVVDCAVFRDLFHVYPDAQDSVHHISVCDTSKIDLQLRSAAAAGPYRWNTGESSRSIRVTQAGLYVCTALNSCSIVTDSFNVRLAAPPAAPMLRDTFICQHVTSPYLARFDSGLIWYTNPVQGVGSKLQPVIYTDQPGTTIIYVARRDGACTSSRAALSIRIIERPEADAPQTAIRCSDIPRGQQLIGTHQQEGMRFEWSTGDTVCCVRPQTDGIFIRSQRNECGSAIDTFTVQSEACERCVAFPDAFTPNEDGRNDRFRALIRCSIKDFRMQVRNRWGEAVYISDQQEGYWDGRHKGAAAQAGVYSYFATFNSVLTGKLSIVEGTVTLIR